MDSPRARRVCPRAVGATSTSAAISTSPRMSAGLFMLNQRYPSSPCRLFVFYRNGFGSVPGELADRVADVLDLGKDRVLQRWGISHLGVERGDPPHWAVQHLEQLVGDPGRDLGAEAPRDRVLVHHDNFV